MEGKQRSEKKRHFGGNLKVFVDRKGENPTLDRMRRNFEKKHLKAYLRGDKRFSFGKDNMGRPLWFTVKELWF